MNTNVKASYGWKDGYLPGSVRVLQEPLLSSLKKYPGQRVIDLGCGNGATARFLTDSGYFVDGIEPDADGCDIARRNVPEGRFINCGVDASASDILTDMERYDFVISTEVIEHLNYPSRLMRLARELLKPDGCLISTTPYHGYLKNLALSITDHWDTHHSTLWEGGHIKFFSFATIEKLVQLNGMVAVSRRGVGLFSYLWVSMIVEAKSLSEK